MRDVNNKFVNFEPNKKEKRIYDKLVNAFNKRSPKDSFLSANIQKAHSQFEGVAKVYSGSHFFQIRAKGKDFSELVGKLRAKMIFQLKRWRAKEKSHPRGNRHLALAYNKHR